MEFYSNCFIEIVSLGEKLSAAEQDAIANYRKSVEEAVTIALTLVSVFRRGRQRDIPEDNLRKS